MLIVEYEGERIELSYSPKFTVRSRDSSLEAFLSEATVDTFDPLEGRVRAVSVSESDWEAYLYFNHLRWGGAKVHFVSEVTAPFSSSPDGPTIVE